MAGHYINTVEDQRTGRPVNGATIKVYNDGATISGDSVTSGTLATIYSDDGVTTIDQTNDPVTTASDGEFDFYTEETRVVIAILFNGTGVAVWNDIDILGGTVSSDVTALAARVDKHDTLLGTAASAEDLGTFTGTTISDTVSVKTALQELETAVEATGSDPLIAGIAALADPNADRLLFWDDSASQMDWNTAISFDGAGAVGIGQTPTQKFEVVDSGAFTARFNRTGVAAVRVSVGANSIYGLDTEAVDLQFGAGGTQYASIAVADGLFTISAGANITPAPTPATNAVGYLGSPQISDQDDYTLVMADAGKHYYHVSATPHTLTIPANASVAFPIGTVIAIVNENGAGAITLAITTDTLRWTDQTGSRTIAANGTASLVKVTSTVWRLTGDGIT